jgi:hypothetical protein
MNNKHTYYTNILESYCDRTTLLGNEVSGSDDKEMYLIDAELLELVLTDINNKKIDIHID